MHINDTNTYKYISKENTEERNVNIPIPSKNQGFLNILFNNLKKVISLSLSR